MFIRINFHLYDWWTLSRLSCDEAFVVHVQFCLINFLIVFENVIVVCQEKKIIKFVLKFYILKSYIIAKTVKKKKIEQQNDEKKCFLKKVGGVLFRVGALIRDYTV